MTCILKTTEGKIAFKVLMKSFQFEKAAMQDHFNNDYVESDEFPKATYNAQIIGFDQLDIKQDGNYEVVTEGELMLHGVSKPMKNEGTITIKGKEISLASTFSIALSDFDIRVPTNFLKRISNTIDISVKVTLEPYER